jgi:predicted acetyltransferase
MLLAGFVNLHATFTALLAFKEEQMMNIQKLDERHFLDVLKMSEYAFQYQVPAEQREERMQRFHQHHLLGILDEEFLAAKLHIIPFDVYLGKEKIPMGGIAGVATYPEYRRRGYVRKMLQESLTFLKENGYLISMLHPFHVAFYRKFGWELFANQLKSTLTKSDLIPQGEVEGTIKRFQKEKHHSDIERVYEQYAQQFSGMLVRTREWWLQSVYSDLFAAVYYDPNGDPKGYLLYEVNNKKMKVEEFVALTKEARKALWNFICQHDSMIEELTMITWEQEPLFFSLDEPRIKQEMIPYFMVRIVDAESFLNQYPFQWGDVKEEVVLHVTDTFAPWNDQSYVITKEQITPIPKDEVQGQGVHLTINTLSTLLFGYKRPHELDQLGLLTGSEEDIERLNNIIPPIKPFFYDFF